MLSNKFWFWSFTVALLSTCCAFYAWLDHPTISRVNHLLWNLSNPSYSPINTTIPTNCTAPPPHTCTFYAACLEPHFHCGPKGYPLGFGEKFCTKFSLPSNMGRLSEKGQTWMWNTMSCLQRALVPELDTSIHVIESKEACKSLEEKAFSTHAPCYLTSGLCSLSPEDWIVIVEIIDLKTLLSSWDAFDGGIEAGEGCLEFFARALEKM
ncbi:hypothetical protein BT96DRAFT_658648 [Gymnopus androsaceus JB14]|uniref:Uncharacterized protein n=1 Tax=Gymnopus androsaceus JB14 TaxID=1447944 RepID=A0A6A4HT49_9AGAR|nr:hypothetical protein BT96DRAFT_658648 [Gymnopus androsaceus JB14]